MAIKNKIFFWLVVLFTIFNIVDTYTVTKILPGEANPIYLLTGSLLVLIIFKFVFNLGIIQVYRKNVFPSHFFYFFFIMILLYGCVLLLGGVASNIHGITDPVALEEAAAVPAAEKASAYSWFVLIVYFIPMSLSLLGFKFYEWSVGRVIIAKQKQKWWQLW